MKKLTYYTLLFLLMSCTSSKTLTKSQYVEQNGFQLRTVSTDPTYGRTEKNPIKVGGVDVKEGPSNERLYLDALAGPRGETVSYYRAGSCCAFESENGFMGMGMLDHYRVTWKGTTDTLSLYLNMYDGGELEAPVGFTIRKSSDQK
ncbi:2-dehydro-3-deoxyphosphooctonate aldolase [Flammeovirga sp. MY04]|uniref:hypothetical protein n=1 Tax=Flammeovirga sp. MY04 TaxID=1191459 RepID=UPI000806428C|nr:hypothetical protein [Flammeovirga sp. MY04]ANQ51709.1 2-dehydro-3-deoxyphosphooctonate aldolase [Flammeovirga sp. MY04]